MQVRRAAIDALGTLREPSAVDAIAAITTAAGDDLTRRTGIGALARIGTPESTRALVALLRDRDCRADASRALTSVTGDGLAELIRGLRVADAGTRCTIIEILGRVRRADMSRAVSAALGDDDLAVRNAAEQALTRRDLRDLEEAIAAAAADENPTVRNAATSVAERE
jgi:HEAT repeat protein